MNINEHLKKLDIFRQENNKAMRLRNDETKIEEITKKKKIIKMYEDILLKLDNINEDEKLTNLPKKIFYINEIIRNYENNRKKLIKQIHFIKDTFNEEFNFLKYKIKKNFMQLKDEIIFLKNIKNVTKKNKNVAKIYVNNEIIDNIKNNEIKNDIEKKITDFDTFLKKNNILTENITKNKIDNIDFNKTLIKHINYDENILQYKIEKMIKEYNKNIMLLNMKRIQAIQIIKYISLKIISITEKDNILIELKKKEKTLKKQKKIYMKTLKNLDTEINNYNNDIKNFTQQIEINNKNQEELFEKLKLIIGDSSLCYELILKDMKKNNEENEKNSEKNSEDSDNLEENEDKEIDIIDTYNKEKIDNIKKENIIICKNINKIRKIIENKKNEEKKLKMKKKNIEKEIELINDEVSIIEDDKKKSISEIKFYITLKLSKFRNIDYVYDKKKYHVSLGNTCLTLSLNQYKDIIKEIKKGIGQKEKNLIKYKNLKKKKNELETINNELSKQINDKKISLKNKLKKYDLNFDFNDLEKKFEEKKKNAILEKEIENIDNEHNKKMFLLEKEILNKQKNLKHIKKKNTLLLNKINEYIIVLKNLNEQNTLK